MKVLKIEGVRGILTAIFVIVCLFAGFVIFPGFVAMSLWDKVFAVAFGFPIINLLQGILLWGIIFISYILIFNGGFALSFVKFPQELNDAEFNMIMRNARLHSNMYQINKILKQREKFEKLNPYNKTEESEHKEQKL